MPLFFGKSKQSNTITAISQPVPCDHPTLASYEGEKPLMQIPKTPPPPPPVPVDVASERDSSNGVVTPAQIVDLYSHPIEPFRPRQNHIVRSSSVYSSSEYEYRESTEPSLSLAQDKGLLTSNQPYSGTTNLMPKPLSYQKPSVRLPVMEKQVDGHVHPSQTAHLNALNRGLSIRYPQSLVRKSAAVLPLYNQALVRPRRQGHWLAKWFDDNDPERLRTKAEEAAEQERRQAEKKAERHEKEMAKLERKMGKAAERRQAEYR